ncbi:hypothetical protein [Micromonospora zhanjiangensis]|uniref:Uncharacterized protein n=1 Tax=Micromonospora zhanjiangensis TaxID=1522057 RepID=A0ABV8KNU9_9ACTN
MSAHQPPIPRYRLHIFDGTYEVLHHRTYVVTLDLNAPGFGSVLDRHLQQLTREAVTANEPMDAPRLEVRDLAGNKVLDWTGA